MSEPYGSARDDERDAEEFGEGALDFFEAHEGRPNLRFHDSEQLDTKTLVAVIL